MFDFDVLPISVEDPELPPPRGATNMGITLDTPLADIARAPALVLPAEATVAAAIEGMRARRRGAAIVAAQQRPLGVVTDRDILAQACGDIDDLRDVPLTAVMRPCDQPLHLHDTAGVALRRMCALRLWHLPLVCAQGQVVGALDVSDLALWLRDRATLMSLEAAFGC